MSEPFPLVMVAALGPNRCIGREGKLPWRVPEDLRHFKAVTMGHAIVMGRKTFETVGKALPGRRNIVVSRTRRDYPADVESYASLQEAIDAARSTDREPYVIGGGQLYRDAMPLASTLLLTIIEGDAARDAIDCDAFFPEVDAAIFELAESRPFETPGVRLETYRRRGAIVSGSLGPR